ncbi:polysaccharide deacetylase family protein [Marinobacter sp. SS13-12]|uniref:polysaccharide deacetylase family protein n=1 Tax=Marinobacter sp. SS13-12 TaxID=3050451 RepID=UPI00255578E5|nr:polysaccharide deacetylase family protein [Marinobacter sp. SS13-12]MDK8464255.1 polysaccharide deacetylase family protein [Marinobacter sp. SS13-12]
MDELWQSLCHGQRISSRSVMFTIDDGFHDHHDVAAKVFDEFGFPLNFFVITGLLDQQLWPWDDQVTYALKHAGVEHTDIRLPSGAVYSINLEDKSAGATVREIRDALKISPQAQVYQWLREELFAKLQVDFPSTIPQEYQPMSWTDARLLRERGHGVYPHTRSHRILSTLDLTEKREEIRNSLERVGAELGYSPQVFAYPTGRPADYDGDDVEELRQAGFNMAFNTVPAYVKQGQDQYQLPRFSLPENTADFLQIVNRFEALKEKLRR